MSPEDVAKLLAVVAAVDNRTVDRAMVMAWRDVLGDVSLAEATDALREFRRESPGTYVEPGHIYRLAKAQRRDRAWDDTKRRPLPPPGKRYAVDVIEGPGELE